MFCYLFGLNTELKMIFKINMFLISIVTLFLTIFTKKSFCDDLLIGETNVVYIKLFHAFNSNLFYEPRGSITISGINSVPIVRQDPLSIESIAALKDGSSEGNLYYLKAVALKSLDDEKPIKTSTTFMRACSLYESFLSDVITVTLDANNQFLSLSASTHNPLCIPSVKSSLPTKLTNFNTTVVVMPTVVSNGPDTQTYIQRLEQEKAEKLRGDKTDNRSFFAKYWMYIVPVVIFLLISGAANPESGGAR